MSGDGGSNTGSSSQNNPSTPGGTFSNLGSNVIRAFDQQGGAGNAGGNAGGYGGGIRFPALGYGGGPRPAALGYEGFGSGYGGGFGSGYGGGFGSGYGGGGGGYDGNGGMAFPAIPGGERLSTPAVVRNYGRNPGGGGFLSNAFNNYGGGWGEGYGGNYGGGGGYGGGWGGPPSFFGGGWGGNYGGGYGGGWGGPPGFSNDNYGFGGGGGNYGGGWSGSTNYPYYQPPIETNPMNFAPAQPSPFPHQRRVGRPATPMDSQNWRNWVDMGRQGNPDNAIADNRGPLTGGTGGSPDNQ